jgi:hypothetical protein
MRLPWLRHRQFPRESGKAVKSRGATVYGPRLELLEDRSVPAMLAVTTTSDVTDTGDGLLSLREAILEANSSAGHDIISFAPGLVGSIALTGGELSISDDLQVSGPGADQLAVNGNGASRVFFVDTGATVQIAGLTVTGGFATDGAGIRNAGQLTLTNVVVNGNVAQGAPNGGNAFGGGIFNHGTLVIQDSAITGNRAVGGDGGTGGTVVSVRLLGVAGGGGVWNDGGSVTVSNSSLSDNVAQGGNGGDARGNPVFSFVGAAIGGARQRILLFHGGGAGRHNR